MKKKKKPILFKSGPGPVYYGGALHYINKEGKVIHDNSLPEAETFDERVKLKFKEIKKVVMSQKEFERLYE